MSFLVAGDTLSGNAGKATAVINGSVENLFFLKKIEAKFDKEKAEIKALGKRGTQHKATGWKGTGSMSIYYMTTLFRKLALTYAKKGKDTYFDITVTNEDETSTIGAQTVVLYNCNIDNTILATLDTESDALEESIDFTFDDFDILDEFGKPIV